MDFYAEIYDKLPTYRDRALKNPYFRPRGDRR